MTRIKHKPHLHRQRLDKSDTRTKRSQPPPGHTTHGILTRSVQMEAAGVDQYDEQDIADVGKRLRRRSMHKRAVEWFTLALGKYPAQPAFLLSRALSFMAMDESSSAYHDIKVLCDGPSPNAKTLILLAKLCLMRGETSEAKDVAASVLARDDRAGDDETKAREIISKAEQIDDILREFADAKNRKDADAAALALQLAMGLSRGTFGPKWACWKTSVPLMNRDVGALSLLEKDIMQHPESEEAQYLWAVLCLVQGRLNDAIIHATISARIASDDNEAAKLVERLTEVQVAWTKATLAVQEERPDDAIAHFEEALASTGEREDEIKGGWLRRDLLQEAASVSIRLRRSEDALSYVQAAIAIDPTSYKLLWTRGQIRFGQCSFREAWEDIGSARRQAAAAHSADEPALKKEERRARIAMLRGTAHDYYAIMGVPVTASAAQIKRVWMDRVRRAHSDKGGTDEEFRLLREAYGVLSNPDARTEYDRHGA